jgi:hypothetical protein
MIHVQLVLTQARTIACLVAVHNRSLNISKIINVLIIIALLVFTTFLQLMVIDRDYVVLVSSAVAPVHKTQVVRPAERLTTST